MLADEAAGLAGGLDRGLLDCGDRGVQLIDGRRGDGHEAGDAQHSVPGRQVCFLLQHVVQLRGRGGVLDLPDLAPLRGVGDELGLLLPQVPRGLIGAHGRVAAEYETIAAAAQRDRWVTLVSSSGLTDEETEAAIHSPAFGALTAELRRAEANHHNIENLLPRLVRARGFRDADDIAAVLHYRLARATQRPAGSGRTRKTPRLIAGLIPEATGTMSAEFRHALTERRDLIEARADALLDTALTEGESWTKALGTPPKDTKTAATWRRFSRTVAAYRDRYGITDVSPLGTAVEDDAQKVDAVRARAAVDRARDLGRGAGEEPPRRRGREPLRRSL